MRLTLRTLLAYLDDTLEPLEIKQIGQKVAESEAAQELIDRIKKVTRRRRLTTPPDSGPNQRFDANVVADYLDNALNSEEVADLEKLCLESDVHLAEIASCHQILTLVLGQPALVPPTARERMYGLITGREAIASRRAAAPVTPARTPAAGVDGDDVQLLGLPARVRASWARVLLPIAGVLLLAVLGAALYLALPRSNDTQVASNPTDSSTSSRPTPEDQQQPQPKDTDSSSKPGPKPSDSSAGQPGGGGDGDNPKVKPGNKVPPKTSSGDDLEDDDPFRRRVGSTGRPVRGKLTPRTPASKERANVGSYRSDSRSLPSILVTSRDGDWRRLSNGAPVYTASPLVSLPGYTSEIEVSSGLRLLLRGYLPELAPGIPFMDRRIESSVVLHQNADVDLDLTLQRGRIYLSNKKDSGPAKALLRFLEHQWTITLKKPGAEVGVELIMPYNRRLDPSKNEQPDAILLLWVMRSSAELVDDEREHFDLQAPPSSAALFRWLSWEREAPVPIRADTTPDVCQKDIFRPKDRAGQEILRRMETALQEVSTQMASDRTVSPLVSLQGSGDDNAPTSLPKRLVAIYSYAALDRPLSVIEALNKNSPEGVVERVAAVMALRGWLNQDARNAQRLYDLQKKRGLLHGEKNARYSRAEAETIVLLLHDPPAMEDRTEMARWLETLADYLQSDQVAIAELAWEQLVRIGQPVLAANKIQFNAAALPEDREKTAQAIRKLIESNKLPPRQQRPGADREMEEPDEPPSRPGRPQQPGAKPPRNPTQPREPLSPRKPMP